MKKFFTLIIFLVSSLSIASSVILKDKIISLEAVGISIIGSGITVDDAKVFALNDGKRNALEMVGTYLESNTTIINHVIEKDEIKTYTGSVLKAEIIKEEKIIQNEQFALKLTIKATIDTELLNKRISDFKNDYQLRSMLAAERKQIEELTRKVTELEKHKNSTEAENKALMTQFSALDWLEKGRESFLRDDYDSAIYEFKQSIEINPKLADAYTYVGLVYSKKVDFDTAIGYYNQAIKLDTENTVAYANLGVAYHQKGDFNTAIKNYNKVIELNTKYADACIYLGLEQLEQDGIDSNNAYIYFLKSQVLADENSVLYYNLGLSYISLGDFDTAIKYFTKAIELNSEYSNAYTCMGIAYGSKGDNDTAIMYFKKAIELNPEDINAYVKLGYAYGSKGDNDTAIMYFKKAIKINPEYSDAYTCMGIAYGSKGNNDSAIMYFKKAIELNPEDARAYLNMGSAYGSKGDNDTAISCFKKAAQLGHKPTQNILKSQNIKW